MRKKPLHYKKPEGDRELLPTTDRADKHPVPSEDTLKHGAGKRPSDENYRATEFPTLDADLFFVFSGGEKRERNYLQSLIPYPGRERYRALTLVFTAPQGIKSGKIEGKRSGSSPRDMMEFWQKVYHPKERTITLYTRTTQLSEIDHIYFLTDLDNFRSQLQSLLPHREGKPYEWIISNPCFEIWLYYSFFDQDPEVLLEALLCLDEEERPRCLKSLNDSLLKGGTDPRKAFDRIETAIANAHRYDKGEDESGIPRLFSTQMKEMASQIWKRISHEFPLRKENSFKTRLRNMRK